MTFQVDTSTGQAMAKQLALGTVTHYAILYVVEKEAFDKLKG